MYRVRWSVAVMCALGAAGAPNAAAAPDARPPAPDARPEPKADKLDAKALMQSGLKLFGAKDFLGALAVFKTAYQRFPSAKILLNIGTTLTKLDRKAEAANVYQQYLDAPDADPAKRADVTKVLAELDAAVGQLTLTVTPDDAEIQINDEDWTAAAGVARHRVVPGSVSVRARRSGYLPVEQIVRATAGASLPVHFALAEEPRPVVVQTTTITDAGVAATAQPAAPRSRLGVIALAHVDVVDRGAAGLFGLTFDATPMLQVQAAALLGPSSGAYAGARYAIGDARLRPIVAAGLPVFWSDGARVAARGAAGIELAVTRRLALVAELGVEYLFNPEADVKHTHFIPALGAAGWL